MFLPLVEPLSLNLFQIQVPDILSESQSNLEFSKGPQTFSYTLLPAFLLSSL